jgi:hypothetical protein
MIPLDRAQAVLYGKFINAAYAMYCSDPANLTPDPGDRLPSGFRMVAWIQMSDFAPGSTQKKFYGFVAESILNPSTHVIAIRGTEGLIEWYDDAMAAHTPFTQVPGAGQVATGFDRIYSSLQVVKRDPPSAQPGLTAAALMASAAPPQPMQGTFAEQIAQLVGSTAPARDAHAQLMGLAVTPSPSVAITGHSLGAALCTLYVMENASKGLVHSPVICTFASPRVGDGAFVTAFNQLAGMTSWHIRNTLDIVPKLPPTLLGYGDVDQVYDFSSFGVAKFSPTCWHSMLTYMHWLDPRVDLDSGCKP